jgi:pimeloyl-ACP methyl ester carboxylesterase
MKKNRVAFVFLFITLPSAFCALFVGCGARRTPDLARIFADARQSEGKRPIIVIPGILGSQLVNRRTGEMVWPSAFRSSDDGLSLPTTPDLQANRDELSAAKILETARLARLIPADVYVYYELLRALREYGGYREGDWNAPAPDGDRDTFYVFAYDWRRDNVETARELSRRVEELKQRLGRPELRFNVVAHSMGGLVARYAAMYGDSDLPDGDTPPQPTWAGASSISKVFMFGTPNEGSAEAFATLLEGYSITEGLRRRVSLLNKLTRADALTIPSLYQLLPHPDAATVLDEHLHPLEVDLYDPSVWRHYGWAAVNDPRYRERYARGETRDEDAHPRHHGSLEELDAYFAAALQRARRFHQALDVTTARDAQTNTAAASPPVSMFVFGGDCEETLVAPVVRRDEKKGTWQTYTNPRAFRRSDGGRVSRREATEAMYEPGDGRVTRRSLLGERLARQRASLLFNTSLPIAYAVFTCDLHSDLQKNKTLQDNALTLLVNEMMR